MTTTQKPRFTFPISLDVTDRRCVVAGGGPLAREKADALGEAGADVVEVPAGEFSPELLDDTFLLIISNEDDTDAAAAFAEAEARGVLTNSLDDLPHCHFAFPSLVRRGDLKLAISSNGRAPALSRQVRLGLEDNLPQGLGGLLEAYATARERLLPRQVPFEVWAAAWQGALANIDELLALVDAGRVADAADQITADVQALLHVKPDADNSERAADGDVAATVKGQA